MKDETYKKFVALTPSKPKTELITDYKAKQIELDAAKTGASSIDTKVPIIPDFYSMYDDRAVQLVLSEKIEKPILSDREKKLFELVQDGKLNELSQRLTVFRKEETVECPYCYQSMTKDYKNSLIASIEKVLSKNVEDHQKVLRSKTIEQLNVDLNPYEKLDGYQACVDLMTEINAAIQKINDNLEMKIANPYEPIDMKAAGIKTLAGQLDTSFTDLEKARAEYNKAAKKTGPIIKELNRINSEIAHYDVVNLADGG